MKPSPFVPAGVTLTIRQHLSEKQQQLANAQQQFKASCLQHQQITEYISQQLIQQQKIR